MTKFFQQINRVLLETWWLWIGVPLLCILIAGTTYVFAVVFLGVGFRLIH